MIFVSNDDTVEHLRLADQTVCVKSTDKVFLIKYRRFILQPTIVIRMFGLLVQIKVGEFSSLDHFLSY